MVRISWGYDHNGCYNHLKCLGHAGYGERGTDIVCSAISVLTHTTILAMEQILGLELKLQVDAETGLIDCKWVNKPELTDKVELLIKTILLGLNEIKCQYPEHLSLGEAEV